MHMGNMNSGGLYLKRNLNGIHCMHLGFNALDTYMLIWPSRANLAIHSYGASKVVGRQGNSGEAN